LRLARVADAGLVRGWRRSGAGQRDFEPASRSSGAGALAESELAIEAASRWSFAAAAADGGSRAHVNDQSVSVGLLRELGERLSRSTVSMTIAACSTRAATAPCPMPMPGQSAAGGGRRRLRERWQGGDRGA